MSLSRSSLTSLLTSDLQSGQVVQRQCLSPAGANVQDHHPLYSLPLCQCLRLEPEPLDPSLEAAGEGFLLSILFSRDTRALLWSFLSSRRSHTALQSLPEIFSRAAWTRRRSEGATCCGSPRAQSLWEGKRGDWGEGQGRGGAGREGGGSRVVVQEAGVGGREQCVCVCETTSSKAAAA